MNHARIALVMATLASLPAATLADAPDLLPQPRITDAAPGPAGPGPGYAPRDIETVADNYTGLFVQGGCWALLADSAHVVDDVQFDPGPWALTTQNIVRSVVFGVANVGSNGYVPFMLRLRFYDTVNYAGADMLAGSTLLATVEFVEESVQPGFGGAWTRDCNVVIPGNSCAIEMDIRTADGSTRMPSTVLTLMGGSKPYGPGASSNSWGRDRDADGVFEGGPVGPGPAEHNQTLFTGGGGSCGYFNLLTKMTGNVGLTCGSLDFDGDGDAGTDADVEAFFRVIGGGSCEP